MRFHSRTLNLEWKKGTKRPSKSNAIDLLCSGLIPDEGIEREDFESYFEEGKVPLQTRQAVCHVAVTVPYTPCGIWVPSFKLSLFSSPDF